MSSTGKVHSVLLVKTELICHTMAQCHQEVLSPDISHNGSVNKRYSVLLVKTELIYHTKAQCQQEVPSPVGKDRMDLSHNVIKRYSVMLVQTLKQY